MLIVPVASSMIRESLKLEPLGPDRYKRTILASNASTPVDLSKEKVSSAITPLKLLLTVPENELAEDVISPSQATRTRHVTTHMKPVRRHQIRDCFMLPKI
jgi:hypothetical protein